MISVRTVTDQHQTRYTMINFSKECVTKKQIFILVKLKS